MSAYTSFRCPKLTQATVLAIRVSLGLVLVATESRGQDTAARDSVAARRRVQLNHDLINAQLEPSYITVGGAPFNIRELGNAPSSLFEGMIVPHLSLYRPDSGRFSLFVTPKVIVRQRTLESKPVRTPSFMPRISAYFALDPVDKRARKGQELAAEYLSLTVSHHSNGQEDPTYRNDSSGRVLNLRNGEFNTNYLEALYANAFRITTERNGSSGYTFVSFGLRYYDRGSTTEELRDTYGLWRLIGRVSSLSGNGEGRRSAIKVELNAQLLAGGTIAWKDRPIGSVDIGFRPRILDDFWLMVGYYHGQDYYNIWGLGHKLRTLRIGIMGTPETGLRNP